MKACIRIDLGQNFRNPFAFGNGLYLIAQLACFACVLIGRIFSEPVGEQCISGLAIVSFSPKYNSGIPNRAQQPVRPAAREQMIKCRAIAESRAF